MFVWGVTGGCVTGFPAQTSRFMLRHIFKIFRKPPMLLQQTQIGKDPAAPSGLAALRDGLPDVSPALLDLLYGSGGSDHLFMLVDATLRREVAGFFDLDSISQPALCLFDGDAAEASAETAPWLVDMSIPDQDNPDSLTFHRKFFDQHWPVGTSVLIQTDAPFEAIRRHLRRFIKLPVQDDGKMPFFRFWDPRVLAPFLTAIADDAPRLRRMLMTDDGIPIRYVVHKDGADRQFAPVAQELAAVPITPMRLHYADFDPIVRDRAAARRQRMADRIYADFAKELEHRPRKAVVAAVDHAVTRFGAYGFRDHAHLHFFAAWTVFYGAGFETRDPTGKLEEICRTPAPELARFKAFRDRFDRLATREI